jgi:hypothetical protein
LRIRFGSGSTIQIVRWNQLTIADSRLAPQNRQFDTLVVRETTRRFVPNFFVRLDHYGFSIHEVERNHSPGLRQEFGRQPDFRRILHHGLVSLKKGVSTGGSMTINLFVPLF